MSSKVEQNPSQAALPQGGEEAQGKPQTSLQAEEPAPVASEIETSLKTEERTSDESETQTRVPSEEEGSLKTEEQASDESGDQTQVPSEQQDSVRSEEDLGLMESMESFSPLTAGEVVRGTILKITESKAIVDVGRRSEGSIPLDELRSEDGSIGVEVGAEIDVLVESYNQKEGTVRISYRKVKQRKAWEDVDASFRDQRTLKGRVIERVKGGLVVDIGVRAFLPGSQVELRPVRNLEALMGQEVDCRVIKVNRKRSNVVVSRKAILEEEQEARKGELREKLSEGAVLTGRVKNLTSYGAFVDLGGTDGLLHVTDLAWGRVNHPSEVLKLDQEISVKVLRVDSEKGRVSLGLKQLSEDPWNGVAERYAVESRVKGRVSSVTDYGAFVELERGVEGLVHISEMTWGKRLRHPSKVVSVGDSVEVIILDLNRSQRRISLSLKKVVDDPWTTLVSRYSEGTLVEGTVRNLTDFGAFVEIEEGVDGLVHLSDLSWTRKAKHPSEILKKGQKLKVVVLKVDSANRRLSLGLKQLQPDVWEAFFSRIKVGDTLPGKVSRKVPFGIFVELVEGIEGLCHSSEIVSGDAEDSANAVEPESKLLFQVIKLNPQEKKVGLSMREVDQSSLAKSAEEQPPVETEEKASAEIQEKDSGQAEESVETLPASVPESAPNPESASEEPAGAEKPPAESGTANIVDASTVTSSEER